jgi:hypothetical protein
MRVFVQIIFQANHPVLPTLYAQWALDVDQAAE